MRAPKGVGGRWLRMRRSRGPLMAASVSVLLIVGGALGALRTPGTSATPGPGASIDLSLDSAVRATPALPVLLPSSCGAFPASMIGPVLAQVSSGSGSAKLAGYMAGLICAQPAFRIAIAEWGSCTGGITGCQNTSVSVVESAGNVSLVYSISWSLTDASGYQEYWVGDLGTGAIRGPVLLQGPDFQERGWLAD